jgi:hypothetical protein
MIIEMIKASTYFMYEGKLYLYFIYNKKVQDVSIDSHIIGAHKVMWEKA